jgi:hypothetical protein
MVCICGVSSAVTPSFLAVWGPECQICVHLVSSVYDVLLFVVVKSKLSGRGSWEEDIQWTLVRDDRIEIVCHIVVFLLLPVSKLNPTHRQITISKLDKGS